MWSIIRAHTVNTHITGNIYMWDLIYYSDRIASCFKFYNVTLPTDWQNAADTGCPATSGYLATVTSDDEHGIVQNL